MRLLGFRTMKNAFDKIAAGFDDAIAYANGDRSRAREATVDVKAIREANNMTQTDFASAYHLRVGALRAWEQGRRIPDTGTVMLLKMIQADPKAVQKIIAKV